MLYREIIADCSQIHTKHINTPCGQNVEFVNVKPSVHMASFLRKNDNSEENTTKKTYPVTG